MDTTSSRGDGDGMMETETAMPPPEMSEQHVVVLRSLLTLARQFIDQGKPSQALQAVVMATRARGGDEAVCQVLNLARELYRSKLNSCAAADDLASLFAECAIAESLPLKSVESEHNTEVPSIESVAHETSILAESGRKQIVLDAFSDGSSFVCLQCGGLVGNQRQEEHYAYWCCKI